MHLRTPRGSREVDFSERISATILTNLIRSSSGPPYTAILPKRGVLYRATFASAGGATQNCQKEPGRRSNLGVEAEVTAQLPALSPRR